MECKFRENVMLWKHKKLLKFNITVVGHLAGTMQNVCTFWEKCKIWVKIDVSLYIARIFQGNMGHRSLSLFHLYSTSRIIITSEGVMHQPLIQLFN
jgi:hypothetical protein